MSMLWVISGAGRGVGKTTVAQNLCEVLPQSVYAKCGHGQRAEHKPAMFFRRIPEAIKFIEEARCRHQHIVVESNGLAHQGDAEIVIFIDGISGVTSFRDDSDQLKAAAHLVVDGSASAAAWKSVLTQKLRPKRLCEAVCRCLLLQKQFLFGSDSPSVRSKIWFETGGDHAFGNGVADLLENVARLGSLQEAAKATGMSYRYAWDLVRSVEDHLGRALLNRHVGGPDGGGSALSEQGRDLLAVFKRLRSDTAEFADRRFLELYSTCTQRQRSQHNDPT